MGDESGAPLELGTDSESTATRTTKPRTTKL